MMQPTITIVYHSAKGHTEQVAQILAGQMRVAGCRVHLCSAATAMSRAELLHEADAIVFGSPTYFGNVSGEFKQFMDTTGSFWYRQPWKDKLAAGFTVSSTVCGDKLHTLQSMMLFACQHGMHWISTGILPRFLNDQQTDGQNRLASYAGLMTQCDNGSGDPAALHPGDQLTAELFAARIIDVTRRYCSSPVLRDAE